MPPLPPPTRSRPHPWSVTCWSLTSTIVSGRRSIVTVHGMQSDIFLSVDWHRALLRSTSSHRCTERDTQKGCTSFVLCAPCLSARSLFLCSMLVFHASAASRCSGLDVQRTVALFFLVRLVTRPYLRGVCGNQGQGGTSTKIIKWEITWLFVWESTFWVFADAFVSLPFCSRNIVPGLGGVSRSSDFSCTFDNLEGNFSRDGGCTCTCTCTTCVTACQCLEHQSFPPPFNVTVDWWQHTRLTVLELNFRHMMHMTDDCVYDMRPLFRVFMW